MVPEVLSGRRGTLRSALTKFARRLHEADLRAHDFLLTGTPFHVDYWPRRRMRAAIAARARHASGLLLDVGCGLKPYQAILMPHVRRYVGVEYSPTSGYRGNRADICGDAAALPLASESCDTVLATELLEHVTDPDRVVAEIARVLRPGGVAIVTVPFMFPIHEGTDYYRYTAPGMAAILNRHNLEVLESAPLTGSGLTLAMLFNMWWFEIGFLWTRWLYPVGVVARPLLLPLVAVMNLLGWIAERALPSSHMSFNHVTVARRPAASRPPAVDVRGG